MGVVDVPTESITPDARFLADLAMISLDIVSMIGQLEDELDIEITTEDLSDIFTIQDLLDYLKKRVLHNNDVGG